MKHMYPSVAPKSSSPVKAYPKVLTEYPLPSAMMTHELALVNDGRMIVLSQMDNSTLVQVDLAGSRLELKVLLFTSFQSCRQLTVLRLSHCIRTVRVASAGEAFPCRLEEHLHAHNSAATAHGDDEEHAADE